MICQWGNGCESTLAQRCTLKLHEGDDPEAPADVERNLYLCPQHMGELVQFLEILAALNQEAQLAVDHS